MYIIGQFDSFKGKHHTEEAKRKIGLANSGVKGPNGQFWINNGKDSKRLLKDDPITDGWVRGSLTKYVAPKAGFSTSDRAKERYALNPKLCIICNNPKSYKGRQYKTCSPECLKVHRQRIFNPYKENSTRRTQVKANGITYDSKPELSFHQKMIELNIKCKKNYKTFSYINSLGETRKYRPDFYLEDHDLFIEIKGRFYYNVDVVNKLINFPHNIVFMFSNNFEDELYSFVCNLFVGRYKGPVSALATNQSLKP